MIHGFREESLMNRDQFWITDTQFLKIAPHLPTDTRGKPRVDDLRVIRSCVEIWRSLDRRAARLRTEEYALQSLCALGRQGRLVRSFPGPCPCRRSADRGADRLFRREGAPLGFGRKRGGEKSRHRPLPWRAHDENPRADRCRPLAFMLTGGQVADCTAGSALLARLPNCEIPHGDKGYDANSLRRQVEERGAMPNIPPKANRKGKNCFSPFLYRNRNAIKNVLSIMRYVLQFLPKQGVLDEEIS